jgi:hypothetical protein
MNATEFEYRNQRWIHLALVGLAFGAYVFDPVDIVWALVEQRPNARALERIFFAVGTLLAGSGAALRTAANRSAVPSASARVKKHLGSVLYAVGVGSLAPAWGFAILTAGELALAIRLSFYERGEECPHGAAAPRESWISAMRPEAAKWGLFLTMIVFTAVLIDRVADVLALMSLLTAAALNWRSYCRPAA